MFNIYSLFAGDIEEDLLCILYAQLGKLNQTFGPLSETSSNPFPTVSCLYLSNPTSSNQLCKLWCSILLYQGTKCIKEKVYEAILTNGCRL